jgi:hypothetical protein
LRYLSRRRSLLIFAALWSTLAPAFDALVGNLEQNPHLFSPHWVGNHFFTMFGLWVALNAAFLWAGMLLFAVVHNRFASPFRKPKLQFAFMLAPLIFLPLYVLTAVLMNLFAFPGFQSSAGALSPAREITDWSLRAVVFRIPYFLTILSALWTATPLQRSFSTPLLDLASSKSPASAASSLQTSPRSVLDPFTTKRFLVFVVGTGLLNALIAGFVVCQLPPSHSPSLRALIERATIYVALGALAGIVGIYLYWHNPASPFRKAPPIPFSLFALASAAAWVWVPAMVMFSEQLSAFTALVGAIGAFLLAAGLRHTVSFAFAPPPQASSPEQTELFAESLYRPPWEIHAYVIAICIYAAGWAIRTQSNYTACTLLALSASLFAWKRTFARVGDLDPRREYKRAALRLALVFIPAVLVTLWAMLDGVAHRNFVEAVNAAQAAARAASAGEDAKNQSKSQDANSISGYQSVILWPVPEKKQLIAPLPPDSLLAPGTTKPLIIKFDGPYVYYQPPNHAPSPNAHQSKGTPLAVDIQTNNFISLIMQAHQQLGASIHTNRCRELQVTIQNGDNRVGLINLAVFLTDTTAPNAPQLYLGQQTLQSSLTNHFTIKLAPTSETLRYPIPANAKIRKFDKISVLFFPDASNYDKGPKVAIDQFELLPR